VWEWRRQAGVYPVAHMSSNRWCMVVIQAAGSDLNNSLCMQSGPGLVPLDSFLTQDCMREGSIRCLRGSADCCMA